MTTLRELGEMLIEVADGRELQLKHSNGIWCDLNLTDGYDINIGREYRLRPNVTYYRVYLDSNHGLCVVGSDAPFSGWTSKREIIKDFEIES